MQKRQLSTLARIVLATGAVGLIASPAAKATVIFSDNFSTSTIPSNTAAAYPTPTATSTGYSIASSKNQSPAPSISSGNLKFGLASTSSGLEEAQAMFTSTPVTLSNVGDFVEMNLTFVDTGILVTGSTTSGQMDFGLYHSGGSAPDTSLQGISSGGLTTGQTTDPSGGVAGWNGYVTQYFFPTTASKIVTRPAQTALDNTSQELIGNNFSSTNAYHSPAGAALGSSAPASAALTGGDQYMEDMKITLTAANTYEIDSTLSDVTNPGTPQSFSATSVTGTNFFDGFDGMAFGYRETGSVVSSMDVNSLTISTNTVPEPGALGLIAVAGLAMRRRK